MELLSRIVHRPMMLSVATRLSECTEEQKKKAGRSAVLIAEAWPAPRDRASSEALGMGQKY